MIGYLPFLRRTGAIALSVLLVANLPSRAEENKSKAIISITGLGEISAPPDIARITSGVVSQAKTAAKALAANSTAMARVIVGLKAASIAAKDIQTSGFSVNPTYFYDQKNRRNPPKIIGYQVRNEVHITVRQRQELGAILDKMITLGANQINGISFAIDKPQKLQDAARKRAVEDALRKVKIYIAATNSKLGRIISISEGQARQPVQPIFQRGEALSARADVPIEAGEQTLRIQVNITWELK